MLDVVAIGAVARGVVWLVLLGLGLQRPRSRWRVIAVALLGLLSIPFTIAGRTDISGSIGVFLVGAVAWEIIAALHHEPAALLSLQKAQRAALRQERHDLKQALALMNGEAILLRQRTDEAGLPTSDIPRIEIPKPFEF